LSAAVKSSQGFLFLDAMKPYAEAAGHGCRGWYAAGGTRERGPHCPSPGPSKGPGERQVAFGCAAQITLFFFVVLSLLGHWFLFSSAIKAPFKAKGELGKS